MFHHEMKCSENGLLLFVRTVWFGVQMFSDTNESIGYINAWIHSDDVASKEAAAWKEGVVGQAVQILFEIVGA